MSNDIDMWNDILQHEANNETILAIALLKVYTARYIQYDEIKAEVLQTEYDDLEHGELSGR